MDKNLNSRPQLPWWLIVTMQTAPLVLQLVVEVFNRILEVPEISRDTSQPPSVVDLEIPKPPDVGIR